MAKYKVHVMKPASTGHLEIQIDADYIEVVSGSYEFRNIMRGPHDYETLAHYPVQYTIITKLKTNEKTINNFDDVDLSIGIFCRRT